MSITKTDQELLLNIARATIESQFDERSTLDIDTSTLSEAAKQDLGVFVTLKKQGQPTFGQIKAIMLAK